MKTYIVDSFTDAPFRGNPAGVCLAERPLPDPLMLQVAQELNLSETAFVTPAGAPGRFGIRFFSPKMEIPLCGHATLASAQVLLEAGGPPELRFTTARGVELTCVGSGGAVEMAFPRYGVRPAEAPPALLAALGVADVRSAWQNDETSILMLELGDCRALGALAPDFAALVRSHGGIAGVLVTAASGDDGHDFHSRYFWPWSGTDEDPVTGGTHTFLTPFWAERLGKTSLRSFQSSRRTGAMEVELREGGVTIRGRAVVVLEGELRLPA